MDCLLVYCVISVVWDVYMDCLKALRHIRLPWRFYGLPNRPMWRFYGSRVWYYAISVQSDSLSIDWELAASLPVILCDILRV